MKFLKQFAILVVAFICIVLVVALFVKNDYHISRSIEISNQPETVFDYLKFLQNHEEFTVWTEKDPSTLKKYSGQDGTVGAIFRWESNHEEVGVGEQEITKIDLGKSIEYDLRFEKPWEMVASAYFTTEKVNGAKTKVIWGFKGNSPWPWNIFLLFMDMEEELSPDLEKGLQNLKANLEVEE